MSCVRVPFSSWLGFVAEIQRAIREKPFWFDKIRDDKIAEKWREEAEQISEKATEDSSYGPLIDFEWFTEEVLEKLSKEAAVIKSGSLKKDNPGAPAWFVRYRDDLVPSEEMSQLDAHLEKYRHKKDWHPGSNDQVLDLIHPSLYCYITPDNKLPTLPENTPEYIRDRGTSQLAWLPTDFEVKRDSKAPGGYRVRSLGYINNAMEGDNDLVVLISTIVGRFLPLFEAVRNPCVPVPDGGRGEVVGEEEEKEEEQEETEQGTPKKRKIDDILLPEERDEVEHQYDRIMEDLDDDDEEYQFFLKKTFPHGTEKPIGLFTKWVGDAPLDSERWKSAVTKLERLVGDDPQPREEGLKYLRQVFDQAREVHKNDRDKVVEAIEAKLTSSGDEHLVPNELEIDDLYARARDRAHHEVELLKHEMTATLSNAVAGNIDAGKPLQIIVKAADIVLTPEKPVYPGGTWHLEGMAHEQIVATGILYYGEENITPSHVEFKRGYGPSDFFEHRYPQCQHDGVWLQHRLMDGVPYERYLGEVVTNPGRCMVFPGDLQHRATPFQLRDHSKPGVRKMLVLFFVNPEISVPSSTSYPKQQGTISIEEAKKRRSMLIEVRKGFNQSASSVEGISLCEH